MKLLLVCLSLILSVATARAEEVRLQGFDRFGRRLSPEQSLRTFPYMVSHGDPRGFVNIARVGYVDSIAPYDYENGKPVNRPAQVDDLIFESLMIDDPVYHLDRVYPLVAEAVRVPEDYSYAIFEIAPGARFTDGVEIAGSDLYYSFVTYKLSSPEINDYFLSVVKDVYPTNKEIRFNFKVTGQQARDAIMALARMKVLKTNTTGNPVMGGINVRYTGSGPYTITQLSPGKISLLRNQFYWGSQLPTRKGFFNFRQIEIISYTNQDSVTTALGKSSVNFYLEDRQTAVKAVGDGLTSQMSPISLRIERRSLVKEAKHSFVFNVSRPFISDVRIRKALLLAYDFDLINQLYHLNQLVRPASLLEGSAFAPHGVPNPQVEDILNQCELPTWKNDAFETYGNRLYTSLVDKRTRLLTVMKLFQEAGLTLADGKLKYADKTGGLVPFTLKFVAFTISDINQLSFYKNELAKLGIDAEVSAPATRDELEKLIVSGDYDLAPNDERLLSIDLIPRVDLAKEMFASQNIGLGHPGTVRLNRLNDTCVDRILESMAGSGPSQPNFINNVQALARLQQILYLNIFAGDSKVTNYFVDRRLDTPGDLSLRGLTEYGYWDNSDKE